MIILYWPVSLLTSFAGDTPGLPLSETLRNAGTLMQGIAALFVVPILTIGLYMFGAKKATATYRHQKEIDKMSIAIEKILLACEKVRMSGARMRGMWTYGKESQEIEYSLAVQWGITDLNPSLKAAGNVLYRYLSEKENLQMEEAISLTRVYFPSAVDDVVAVRAHVVNLFMEAEQHIRAIGNSDEVYIKMVNYGNGDNDQFNDEHDRLIDNARIKLNDLLHSH